MLLPHPSRPSVLNPDVLIIVTPSDPSSKILEAYLRKLAMEDFELKLHLVFILVKVTEQ